MGLSIRLVSGNLNGPFKVQDICRHNPRIKNTCAGF